jgi:integrase
LKYRAELLILPGCALSSVVEHYLHTVGVAGSKPAARTINPNEIEDLGEFRTDSAQSSAESVETVKFPKKIKFRGRVLAKIYGKSKAYPYYRLCYSVAGKRRVRSFRTYAAAKAEGDTKASELHKGSQAAAFSGPQSRDALAAMERLQTYYESTGRRVSLLGAVSEYVEAVTKLGEHPLGEAVGGFLRDIVSVQRKGIGDAVEEFLKANAPLTRAAEGQRAQLSAKYAYNRQIQLRRFAAAFPATCLCDLTKDHLDGFIGSLGEFSAKSRNHYRTTIRQFLHWAVRKDYLAATHRLLETDSMRPEHANTAEVHFYTPMEFAALLEAADDTLRPLVAIGGLAGLRTAEMLRLDWAEVWRVPGHIEITAGKSKTRQRRLVEICPTLAAWLAPFRTSKAGSVWSGAEKTFQEHFTALCEDAKVESKGKKVAVTRKTNGLRHSFCSFHFALHSNENLTAAQAGNSPAMVHNHYKGLTTKAEARMWFAVKPKGRTPANVVKLATAIA